MKEEIQSINSEKKSLLDDQVDSKKCCNHLPVYIVGAVVGLPTAILNGFSNLEEIGSLGSIGSLEQLYELLKVASIPALVLSAFTFLVAEAVLFYLNGKYLLDSAKSVINILKKDLTFLYRKIFQSEIQDANFEKISLIEHGLFIWTFMTSLIFAEIGGETLSFLGNPGFYIGFILNLLVFFATRFSGAKMFFEKLIEGNADNFDFSNQDCSLELNNFLYYSSKSLGYMLAIFSIFPVIVTFIPASIQGLQKITHNNLLASSNYQDAFSIIVGIILTLPTLFFYSVSIKKLPMMLLETAVLIKKELKNKNFKFVLKILTLSVVAFFSSYFTSIGFRLVAYSNIFNGYTSYLGSMVENCIPDALFTSIIMMFWSHLQELVNPEENLEVPIKKANNLNRFFCWNKKKNIGEDVSIKEDGENRINYNAINSNF